MYLMIDIISRVLHVVTHTETTEIKLEIVFINNFERDMIEGDLKAWRSKHVKWVKTVTLMRIYTCLVLMQWY